MTGIDDLYVSCPKQTLQLAASVFNYCLNERLVPALLDPKGSTEKIETVLRGVIAGAAVRYVLFRHGSSLMLGTGIRQRRETSVAMAGIELFQADPWQLISN